jgi:DNA-binding IclR family transcriptional regulator
LNTVVRPAAYREARPVSDAFLRRLRQRWGELAEIVVPFRHRQLSDIQADKEEMILATLKRRPCTTSDLAASCALVPAEVVKYLDLLRQAGKVRKQEHAGETFYFAG